VPAKILVLVDGWLLIYQPNSPAACHLLTLLTCKPDGIEVALALPGEPPAWLTGNFNPVVRPSLNDTRQRIYWEQRSLPALAREVGADQVHLSSAIPALFARKPNLQSPVEVDEPIRFSDFYERLRYALSAGGTKRLSGLVWPSDLPPPPTAAPVYQVTPAPPFGWLGENEACPEEILGIDLPETYILYNGPCYEKALHFLLETYRWAGGAVGEDYPLLILGIDEGGRERLPALLDAYGLQGFVQALPQLSPVCIPWLYRKCSVLYHPAEIAPWGNALRNALACGRPVVAGETPRSDALVGPAAYLAALDKPKELGGALLTIVVEEELADRLATAARQRAAGWQLDAYCQELGEIYRRLSEKNRDEMDLAPQISSGEEGQPGSNQ
jgi:glycosyltransferase involved in cell wall biosynthesis